MLNIGKKITELRKEKGWSQTELAKLVNASRDIIGKYERNEHSPSIEMAAKIAEAFDVTVDYLINKEQFATYDKNTIKRLQDIQNLDENTKGMLMSIIDTFVRDAKTRMAYQ